MRGAARDKGWWKRRRTPTQDPSTDLRSQPLEFVAFVGADELLVFAQDTALNIDATPCAFGHLASKACSPPTNTCCTRGRPVLLPSPCRAAGSVVFQIDPLCSDQPVFGSGTAPVSTAGGPCAGPEIVTGAPAGTAIDSRYCESKSACGNPGWKCRPPP